MGNKQLNDIAGTKITNVGIQQGHLGVLVRGEQESFMLIECNKFGSILLQKKIHDNLVQFPCEQVIAGI